MGYMVANHFGTKLIPVQSIVTHRRIVLAAKIVRHHNGCPMRMVSFEKDTVTPVEALFRPVGRPRKAWTQNTLTTIWLNVRHNQGDFKNSNKQLAQTLQAPIGKELQQDFLPGCN